MTSLPLAHPFAVPAALDLARRGLAVFRIEPWSRLAPIGWQKSATTDPAQVSDRFARGGNIGVACRASSIVVLDLDRHGDGPDGVAGWEALCTGHDKLETFTVVSPRRGYHVYFQVPPDVVIASSSGFRRGLPPGIDVRAPGRRSGGYVLGPGSQTEVGRYRIANDAPVAPLPEWVAARLH